MAQLASLGWKGHADASVSDSEQITCPSILKKVRDVRMEI